MGLFDFLKTAPRPHSPCHVEIVLDQDPRTRYRPGATVSGTVYLRSSEDAPVQGVHIFFFGTSSTYIRISSSGGSDTRYEHYRDTASLFNKSSQLVIEPQVLLGTETYRLPFSFSFPISTDDEPRQGIYRQVEEPQWTVEPHALPSSYSCTEGESSNKCSI